MSHATCNVVVRLSLSALSELVLIAIHVDPDTVMEELEALHAVHAAVARRWKTDDILIMGDFNADSKYISRKTLDGLKLRVDSDTFKWLISDDVDTTTADNDYTYDRSPFRFNLNSHIFTRATLKPPTHDPSRHTTRDDGPS